MSPGHGACRLLTMSAPLQSHAGVILSYSLAG